MAARGMRHERKCQSRARCRTKEVLVEKKKNENRLTVEHESIPRDSLERLGGELFEPARRLGRFPTVHLSAFNKISKRRVALLEVSPNRFRSADVREPFLERLHLYDLSPHRR